MVSPPPLTGYSSRLNPYVSSHEFHWSFSPGSARSHLSSYELYLSVESSVPKSYLFSYELYCAVESSGA